MATTVTPNLKLRVDSNLTANAKYNLNRIDLLGSTFLVDSTNTLNIRSQTDLIIEPNSADIGGSATGGSVTIGTPNHKISALNVYATELYLDGAFNLLDQATGSTGKLGLQYKSDTNGAVDNAARQLIIDVNGANRTLILGGNLSLIGNDLILRTIGPTDVSLPQSGTLSTLAEVETLTNKSINADQNTLTNIADASIKAAAGIQGTKILPQFGAQNIRTSGTLELANGAYTTALAHAAGGQTQNLTFKLPNSYGTNNAILSTDGAGNLNWSSAGSGSVTSVDFAAPAEFVISGNPVTTAGTITLTKANQTNNQVYAGPAAGAAAQPSFRSLVLADLPALSSSDVGLGNVPNVDATNPANINQSASFRFVTDTEKSTWNGKQDALGFTPENAANRGIANGYVPLNASGKIENSYLNTSVMSYHGTWNAATNTPALADGMIGADPGDIYIVSVAGTQNLGSGNITFGVDDWVIYSQTNVWQKVSNSSAVASVNGATGAVIVNAINELTGDVTAGPASGSASAAATIANGAITNAKISASAAISVSKLAAGTDGYVLQTVAGVPQWTTAPVSVQSYKTNWVTADGTTKAITHSMGTTDVIIQVFDKSTGATIEIDNSVRTDINTVTLTASQSPGASGWRVLILAI